MEISLKKIGTATTGKRIFRIYTLFLLLAFTAPQRSSAQENDSLSGTASSSSVEDGFAKKENTSKLFDEARKIQEQNRKDEIIQYAIMVLGFSVVIAIAWFTTSLARKRKKKEDAEKMLRVSHLKHKPHHHHPRR